MTFVSSSFVVTCLLSLFLCVSAQVQYCSSSSVCIALETHENSTTNAADLYFQISAQKSQGWGAMGIGDGMKGALMFILYPDGTDQGVTVSVRTATGHVEPSDVTSNVPAIAVMNTSVTSDRFMANIVCYNCASWTGTTLDVTSTSQPWIWSVGGSNQKLVSTDVNAQITQHASYGQFTLDMGKSKVAAADTSSSSTGTTTATATGSSSSARSSASSTSASASPAPIFPQVNLGDTAASNTGATAGASGSSDHYGAIVAHAVFMLAAFFVLFPSGVVLLRVSQTWSFVAHWTIQVIATLAAIIGAVIMIWYSLQDPGYKSFKNKHQILGLVIVCAMIPQVVMGWVHHLNYKKYQTRTAPSHLHMWLGRTVLILAVLNAGWGYRLGENNKGAIAAWVVGAIVILMLGLLCGRHARLRAALNAPVWRTGPVVASAETLPGIKEEERIVAVERDSS
ncbi:hypothetical protein YB2330_006189 [Saitoella coloradoensis]